MPKLGVLQTRVDDDEKRRFTELAVSRGTSPSDVLRKCVLDYLGTKSASDDAGLEAMGQGARWKVVNARVTSAEWDAMRRIIAAEKGSVTGWLLSLIRERIVAGPQLREEEVQAVVNATYQLRSIGRNLNQMVRAVHQGKASSASFNERYAVQLNERVTNLAESLEALVRRSGDRGAI